MKTMTQEKILTLTELGAEIAAKLVAVEDKQNEANALFATSRLTIIKEGVVAGVPYAMISSHLAAAELSVGRISQIKKVYETLVTKGVGFAKGKTMRELYDDAPKSSSKGGPKPKEETATKELKKLIEKHGYDVILKLLVAMEA